MSGGALGLLDVYLAAILVLLGASALLDKPVLAGVNYARRGPLRPERGLRAFGEHDRLDHLRGFRPSYSCGFATRWSGVRDLEDVQHRTVLPLGRGEAAEAFEADLGEQVGPVEQEAGVRKQL